MPGRRIIDVDQAGVWLGIRAVVARMRGRGGSIVNISSDAGLFGMAMVAACSSATFAARGITRSAAVELAPEGICVNSIHPGFIDTAATRPAGIAESIATEGHAPGVGVPLGRIGTPREVANLVLFLAPEESSYCTGAEFVIDGGTMAGPVPD
jgi:3alpha(or 20beta)-hydroxysteroid dehydrogenase